MILRVGGNFTGFSVACPGCGKELHLMENKHYAQMIHCRDMGHYEYACKACAPELQAFHELMCSGKIFNVASSYYMYGD